MQIMHSCFYAYSVTSSKTMKTSRYLIWYQSWFNFVPFCYTFIYRLGNKVKLSWKLTSITKSDSKGYALVYETPEGIVSVQAKSVIMPIPSYIASDILRPLSVSIKLIKFYVTVNWSTVSFLTGKWSPSSSREL
jgi:hypothetical protein